MKPYYAAVQLYKEKISVLFKRTDSIFYVEPIEILDLECVLCHVTGVQNENKNALINPSSWIFPRSVVYKMSWGEFNLPL